MVLPVVILYEVANDERQDKDDEKKHDLIVCHNVHSGGGGVPQPGPPQQQLGGGHRHGVRLLPLQDSVPRELVQVPVGLLSPRMTSHPGQVNRVGHSGGANQHRPDIEVGLHIQVSCLYVAHTLGLGGSKEDQICREKAGVLEAQNITDTNFDPLCNKHFYFGVVHLHVCLVPLDVLHHLLDRGDSEDEEEGLDGDILPSGGSAVTVQYTERKYLRT